MSDSCTLSAQDRALSTVLTAFVGTIVTGVSNGPQVAFIIAMMCWLAAVRVITISALGLVVTLFGPQYGIREPFLAQTEVEATASDATSRSDKKNSFVNNLNKFLFKPKSSRRASFSSRRTSFSSGRTSLPSRRTSFSTVSERDLDVSFLGSLGWIYTFIYTPPIQIMWVVANWSLASPGLKITRAIGLGVTALSYTIDTRARYGMALGKKIGSKRVVPRLMNVYSAAVNLLLSVIVVVLLIRSLSGFKGVIVPIVAPLYVVFSIFFAVGLWRLGPHDGENPDIVQWPGQGSTLGRLLYGLLVGAIAGVFVAAPALVMWQNAKFAVKTGGDKDGVDLQTWLGCKSVLWWEKAVQILP